MRPAVQLLEWFWWRHKVLLTVSFISVVVAQIVYWSAVLTGLDTRTLTPLTTVLHCSFFAALGTALTVFTHGAELDLTSGKSSLPRWLHYLPVPNYMLAVVPMVALIGTLAWAWFPYQFAMLHFYESKSPTAAIFEFNSIYYIVLIPAVLFFASGMWIQATSWLPFRFAVLRAGVLFGLGYFFVTTAKKPLISIRENDKYDSIYDALVAEGSWELNALAFGMLATGAIVAVWSVSIARRRTSLAELEWSGNIWTSLSSQQIYARQIRNRTLTRAG